MSPLVAFTKLASSQASITTAIHLALPKECHWNCELTMCCGHFVGNKKGEMH